MFIRFAMSNATMQLPKPCSPLYSVGTNVEAAKLLACLCAISNAESCK